MRLKRFLGITLALGMAVSALPANVNETEKKSLGGNLLL